MGKEQELVQSIRGNDVESFRKIIGKFKSKSSKFLLCIASVGFGLSFCVKRNNTILTEMQTNHLNRKRLRYSKIN